MKKSPLLSNSHKGIKLNHPIKEMIRNALPTPSVAVEESFDFAPFTLSTVKNHILPSKSSSEPGSPTSTDRHSAFHQLTLPHLPDMVFPDNIFRMVHSGSGKGLEFNTLDALKRVDDHNDSVKVAVAEAWQGTRTELDVSHKVSHPFDWTFTTDYRGTLLGEIGAGETEGQIDMEKLKQKEKILFYDEIHLYEDELADHGCASCSVKVRVMPSGIFALQRFYLRVDDVLIRINDTRIYFEKGNDFILREYTSRESRTKDLKVPRVFWGNPNEISQHLPIINSIKEELKF